MGPQDPSVHFLRRLRCKSTPSQSAGKESQLHSPKQPFLIRLLASEHGLLAPHLLGHCAYSRPPLLSSVGVLEHREGSRKGGQGVYRCEFKPSLWPHQAALPSGPVSPPEDGVNGDDLRGLGGAQDGAQGPCCSHPLLLSPPVMLPVLQQVQGQRTRRTIVSINFGCALLGPTQSTSSPAPLGGLSSTNLDGSHCPLKKDSAPQPSRKSHHMYMDGTLPFLPWHIVGTQ